MKQMTGYFGGYISKKQQMGQFELKQSAAAMPFFQDFGPRMGPYINICSA